MTRADFEKLFRDYYSRLYYFAYDFVENEEVSKDIVSDVFTAVWDSRNRMEEESVVGYLFVSVRNQCLNYIKQQKNKEELLPFYLEATLGEDSDYYKTMENRIEELAREIEKLPPRTRYILEECYFHHKKYKEVADVLEITPDGIKKHIVKAFSVLRKHFNVKKG